MAEYVKASYVTSYIKGYAQRTIDLGGFDLVDDILTICENIEKMPAADVVEVVKCKDCRWTYRSTSDGLVHCGYPIGLAGKITDNDFCSYGERKSE